MTQPTKEMIERWRKEPLRKALNKLMKAKEDYLTPNKFENAYIKDCRQWYDDIKRAQTKKELDLLARRKIPTPEERKKAKRR